MMYTFRTVVNGGYDGIPYLTVDSAQKAANPDGMWSYRGNGVWEDSISKSRVFVSDDPHMGKDAPGYRKASMRGLVQTEAERAVLSQVVALEKQVLADENLRRYQDMDEFLEAHLFHDAALRYWDNPVALRMAFAGDNAWYAEHLHPDLMGVTVKTFSAKEAMNIVDRLLGEKGYWEQKRNAATGLSTYILRTSHGPISVVSGASR